MESPKGVPRGPQKGPETKQRGPGDPQERPGDPNMTPFGGFWGTNGMLFGGKWSQIEVEIEKY